MANASNADWDEAAPADNGATGKVTNGAAEVRYLRGGVADRINKEHVDCATSGAGGEHVEGSARVWCQAAAPTTLPDGATAITGNEALAEGMVFVDTDDYTVQVYTGSAWHSLTYALYSGDTADGHKFDIDVDDASQGIDIDVTVDSGQGINIVLGAGSGSSSYGIYMVSTTAGVPANIECNTTSIATHVMKLNALNNNAHLNLGGDPTVASPNDGDIWFDGTNLKMRIGATTYNIDMTSV
jgi:hypothetical protein